MIETGLIAARFVHYAALALLFGGWAYAGFGADDPVLRPRYKRLAIWSAAAVLISSVAVLAATTAGLGGSFNALADTELWSTVIQETDFGTIWCARLALALLATMAALAWNRHPGHSAQMAGLILAGGLVVSVAWTGHAAIEEGAAGQLHRWADALHLAAAVVWLGALLPLLWLLSSPGASAQASRRLMQFHAIGLVAVLTLFLSGVVNSFFLVGTPTAMLTTSYGQLLAAKLLLFAGMVVLAASNRFRHAPSLARSVSAELSSDESISKLRGTIRVELALGLMVLAIVSILGAIAPAAST
jgi:copper resistance protein D